MRIVIVGPGVMPIPPTGWGAVEILVWDQNLALKELGHDVKIINTPNPTEIIEQINTFRPDFVHIQYDDFIGVYPYIQYPCAITSHYGYLEQPEKWGYYTDRLAKPFVDVQPRVFCLSKGIKEVYKNVLKFPEEKLYVTPNGVNTKEFTFKDIPKYPNRSLYLAKIDYHRKRQHMFQSIDTLYYAGNIADPNFNPQRNYLGEWSKETLYSTLTEYGNLVLLSDGEAHPLVCMEALAAGLGIVVTEWGIANLDTTKEFITMIPENRVSDISYVKHKMEENRLYSINHRQEILEYSKQFDWVNVIRDTYIPSVESVIEGI